MSETLIHRGPDAEGTFVKGGVGLASRRLAIIDLAGGDQPISNEDGTCTVVQNGEIYNYAELNHSLERAGHTLRTRSDTETIVHAYEEWDLGFAERLRGMFAIAIWDARRKRLVLARDRFGIKPLYYRDVDGELSFASELDALPKGDLDLDALEAFLATNTVPGPLSIFREIRKLPPGHMLTWEDGNVALERFARPGPLPVRVDDEAELLEECRARLRDSVRAHLVSDVPVGVLLSGGVDSGALAALASEESSEPVRTFSIGFEEQSFDELAGARAVSERYGTRHRELVLRPDAALLLPALADAFDEPFADSSALPTYLVSRLAAEDVKVALSGEGGDELFGGYYTYAADLLAERFGRVATLAGPAIERLPSSSRRASFDYRAKRFVRAAHLPPLERHEGWKTIFSADARAELTGQAPRLGPALARARPVRRDRGLRATDPAAGRRPRRLPRRRPAREDRPRLDGVVARDARAVPRPCRRELRLLAARAPQGAGPVEEAAAAEGAGADAPRRWSSTAASVGSRSRPRPGYAESSSRSPVRRWRPRRCAARDTSGPRPSPRCSTVM